MIARRFENVEDMFTFLSLSVTHVPVDVEKHIFKGDIHLHDLHVRGALFMQDEKQDVESARWYVRMPYYLLRTLFNILVSRSDTFARKTWEVLELLMWRTPAMFMLSFMVLGRKSCKLGELFRDSLIGASATLEREVWCGHMPVLTVTGCCYRPACLRASGKFPASHCQYAMCCDKASGYTN